ncbi:hypothetical protein LMA00_07765 [Burkholderia ambifaria]|uniref:hypothetical protein n=1 Tax=Burkholderia ambifaria TaxID=152480 RepID=UPI001E47DE19|nr:hypothetical protein [Burkholderia ambifaria]UEP49635.1 hypothetical protein LMA00_07765 [Burkholderia ambifaria]
MSEIKINVGRTNTTTHRAVLNEVEIKRILADKVCGLVGVERTSDEVQIKVYLSCRMGSCGSENSAEVEVIVDHNKLPEAGEA